jgi:hypothetical protein
MKAAFFVLSPPTLEVSSVKSAASPPEKLPRLSYQSWPAPLVLKPALSALSLNPGSTSKSVCPMTGPTLNASVKRPANRSPMIRRIDNLRYFPLGFCIFSFPLSHLKQSIVSLASLKALWKHLLDAPPTQRASNANCIGLKTWKVLEARLLEARLETCLSRILNLESSAQ